MIFLQGRVFASYSYVSYTSHMQLNQRWPKNKKGAINKW